MGRRRENGQGLFCLPEGEIKPIPEPLPPPDMRPEPPPIQSEVDKAITLLSFGKAPDIHNCPADLIKMSGEHGKKASYTYARKFGTRIAGHQSGRNSNLFCSTNPEIRKKAPTTEQL